MSTSPQDFGARISDGMITAHLGAIFADLPVYIHAIEHADGVVLVDTGMIDSTPELDEEGAPVPMPENIPRDVVCVVNTHLHFDHCGGNRLFPGVPIHVQRLELQGPYDPPEWVDFPGATYVEHDGEAEVLPGIRLLPTPGHTPGHQSVLVDTPEGLVVIGGDVAYTFDELASGETEGIPNVLKEAMATGIPVIGTWHSGIPELVTDGVSGLLVPERDVDALAEALVTLVDHPGRWPAMGLAGRQRVEAEFDSDKLNQELVELYEQVLLEGSRRRPEPTRR